MIEAVEEVIVEHYEDQIKFLEKEGIERSMLKKIKFQADEDTHKKSAITSNNENNETNPRLFKALTKNLTKIAIEISKKI